MGVSVNLKKKSIAVLVQGLASYNKQHISYTKCSERLMFYCDNPDRYYYMQ